MMRDQRGPRRTALGIRILLMLLCTVGGVLVSAASSEAATVDGLEIHATVTGTGRTTVFLVHGYSCDETTWSEQVPVLAKQFRVVALDLPGHGLSDTPRVEQFSMELFARAIEAVRAEVDAERIVLVGHSMGTPVILTYARLYPQRTEALVFVEGLMPPAQPLPASASEAISGRMGGPDGRRNREAMIIQRFFAPDTTPAVRERVLHMMLSTSEATAVGAMRATNIWRGQAAPSVAPDRAGIPAVPMLGIYAEPAPIASREDVLRNFPRAVFTQIPGTGHFLMLEKPAEFNAKLLQFLNALP